MAITPATLALTANRWTPFVYAIQISSIDLSAATVDMHIRSTYDASGSAIVDLSPAAAGSQGLSLAYSSGNTTLTIQIDETTMEALPDAAVVGDDKALYYDIHITPSGGTKQVYFRGTFTVRAGATQ